MQGPISNLSSGQGTEEQYAKSKACPLHADASQQLIPELGINVSPEKLVPECLVHGLPPVAELEPASSEYRNNLVG